MAGTCVERLPHSCGSVDSLQVFEEDGKFSGYCFNCGKYVPDPYSEKPVGYAPTFIKKTAEMIEQEMRDINECPSLALSDRMLRKETLERFGVKVGVSETDGKTPTLHYYPYTKQGVITGYKVRLIKNKRMWSVGDVKDCDLFGWNQAMLSGAKTLYIVEGEIDAMSLFQMLKDRNRNTVYADFDPAVTSIPHGAGAAAKDISRLLPTISKSFQNIVFVPDNDDAGNKAADELSRLVSGIKIARTPCKDANACLLEGRAEACCKQVLFKAETQKNTRLLFGTSLTAAAKKRPEMGLDFPWEGLTKLLRGKRRGETHYWGAGEGIHTY